MRLEGTLHLINFPCEVEVSKTVTPKQKEGMILGGYPHEIIKLKTPHIVRHGKAIGHNLYRNRAYTRQTQMKIPT
jgi:hypothetical protein